MARWRVFVVLCAERHTSVFGPLLKLHTMPVWVLEGGGRTNRQSPSPNRRLGARELRINTGHLTTPLDVQHGREGRVDLRDQVVVVLLDDLLRGLGLDELRVHDLLDHERLGHLDRGPGHLGLRRRI